MDTIWVSQMKELMSKRAKQKNQETVSSSFSVEYSVCVHTRENEHDRLELNYRWALEAEM